MNTMLRVTVSKVVRLSSSKQTCRLNLEMKIRRYMFHTDAT